MPSASQQDTAAATDGADSGEIGALHRSRTGWPGLALVVLAVVSGLATYLILTGLTPLRPAPGVVATLLWFNAALVLLMAVLIGWHVYMLVKARRRQLAGAGLHGRIVTLLSLFAAVPAIIVAVFASVTLNRGLDAWFSQRTQAIVNRAVNVAQTYVQEKTDLVRIDLAGLSNDLEAKKELFASDRQAFIRHAALLAAVRGLAGLFVIDRKNFILDVVVRANDSITFRPPPPAAFEEAGKGKALVMGPGPGDNIIRGLKKLPKLGGDRYLYIYRAVNEDVLKQLVKARQEQQEFATFKKQRFGLQITFALMYASVTFIFLLAAIWFGLWLADRLVEPVVGLIHAARKVSRGDLDVKLPVKNATGDIATLLLAFNQMTTQLKAQRQELLDAYHKLDERRRFTEAMLAGATAGVIGLDRQGRITLANRSAQKLLGLSREELMGCRLSRVLPEFAPVLNKARRRRKSGFAEEHVVRAIDGEERTFMVRVTSEGKGDDIFGYVITFDDITDMLNAQRNAAWADIARRIAHEIKNPLTPIQLSAERLKRRYLREISNRPEIFEQCTDTIIRQVGDIGRMVDEFSSFARMPAAQLEEADLVQVVKEALLLQRVSSDDIGFEMELPDEPLVFPFDRRLITQAITNLVKNARESIEARLEKQPEPPGRIRVEVIARDGMAHIRVIDNGLGLPKKQRQRLTEPYMTTREKGTGLGLAIVKRIMEEHGGQLLLDDAPGGQGAMMTLSLSISHGHEAERRQAAGDGEKNDEKNQAAGKDEQAAKEERTAASDAGGDAASGEES